MRITLWDERGEPQGTTLQMEAVPPVGTRLVFAEPPKAYVVSELWWSTKDFSEWHVVLRPAASADERTPPWERASFAT